MPNYSFVVDATYDPMTYAEISAPVRESAQLHTDLMDKYDEMRMNSELFDRYIGDADVKTRAMFNKYMSDLNNATDTLMQHGAWGQRNTLSSARQSYSRNMMPIQLGYQKRAQEAAAQQQAKAKNPLLEFSHDATNSGLDWYLDNPNGGFQTIDPVVTAASVGQIAKSFAKMYRENPEGFYTTIRSLGVDSGFIESIQQKGGWNPEDILNYKKDPIMRAIMNTVLKGQGMAGFDDNGNPVGNEMWDAATVQRVGDFASQGLAEGVGGQVVTAQADPYEMAYAKAASKGGSAGGAGGYAGINDSMIDFAGLPTNGKEVERLKEFANSSGFTLNNDGTLTNGSKTALGAIPMDMFINDRLKTRDEFVRTSKRRPIVSNGRIRTLTDDRLKQAYDKYIQDLKSIGVNTDGTVTQDMVRQAILDGYKNAMGTGYKLIGLNMDMNDLSNNIKTNAKLKRIGAPDASGRLAKEQKGYTTVGALLKDDKNAEITVSLSRGNEGLVFHTVSTRSGKDEYYMIQLSDITDGITRQKIQNLINAARLASSNQNDASALEAFSLLRDDLINSLGAHNAPQTRRTNPDTNKE